MKPDEINDRERYEKLRNKIEDDYLAFNYSDCIDQICKILNAILIGH